jgi:hypothetical protein
VGERIAAEAASTVGAADVPHVRDLHATWRRGELSVGDKGWVLAAIVERNVISCRVRGTASLTIAPEDRVLSTWRSTRLHGRSRAKLTSGAGSRLRVRAALVVEARPNQSLCGT